MTQTATVEKLLPDGRAEIVVARQSACAHDCGECAGCGTSAAPVHALADNRIGALPGQKVVVESETRKVIGVALLVYMLPVALFFAGYAAAFALDGPLRAAVAILAFFFGVILTVLYDRRVKRNGALTFTIVRVF